MPTAFIFERPVEVSPEAQSQSQPSRTTQPSDLVNASSNVLDALSRDMLSFMEMTSSPSTTVNAQPTTASVPTPVESTASSTTEGATAVSTNPLNTVLENSISRQMSRSLGNLLSSTQESSTTLPQISRNSPMLYPQLTTPSSSSPHMTDPFLPCHSRHFTSPLRHMRGRHPIARGTGRTVRRGRSAGTNLSDTQAQQTQPSNLPPTRNSQVNLFLYTHLWVIDALFEF